MSDLINALRNQKQYDEHGEEVIVSRQACDEAADTLEAQAKEITELKVNNNALKDVVSFEKKRSADYKALCDQLGEAIEEMERNPSGDYTDQIAAEALAAWRAMK